MALMRRGCFVLAALLVVGCGDTGDDGATPGPDMGDMAMNMAGRDLRMPEGADLAGVDAAVEDQAMGDAAVEDQGADGDALVAEDMGGDALATDASQDQSAAEDMTMPFADLIMAGGDGAVGTCANNAQSCGMFPMCVDCTNSPAGHACVGVACGCNGAGDCPTGSACNPNTHLCSTSCAGGLPCSGGCCDGMNCVAGTANNACGGNGGACVACGNGTPTCAAGACTATCAPGGNKGGGACGNGFCCGSMNTCVAVDDHDCGLAGAACVDCGKDPAGPVCNKMAGVCGCGSSKDCPLGEACLAGVCGTKCDANDPCNGGCCENGTCVPGTQANACGFGGTCVSCLGNLKGAGCVVGNNTSACGCNSAADCPPYQACDPSTHLCGWTCDINNPCNGGCCSASVNGQCEFGNMPANCGRAGGVCANCATELQTGKAGDVCVSVLGGGVCGCNNNTDCPPNSAGCNLATRTCVFACSAKMPCLSGCCSIPPGQNTGSCIAGTADTSCGNKGLCLDCTKQANAGHVCLPGTQSCGCNGPGDCPSGMACDLNTHACTTACSAMQACNGGCCAIAPGQAVGVCGAGNAPTACGGMPLCVDCSTSKAGHACIGAACGCANSSDCPADTACNMNTHLCETACGDANHTVCNGGCCAGNVCATGTQNGACGTGGGICAACTAGTPTCVAGACTDACGAVGNGTCSYGTCCQGGRCVAGNQQTACGDSGTCSSCMNSPNGNRCETGNANGPWFCGCDGSANCPAANPQAGIGGEACDTQAHTCTTTCGVNGVTTPCNGGCCQFANGSGTCRAGTAVGSCGAQGGLCSNCQASCGQVADCNGGTCGCCSGANQGCVGNGDCCSGTCRGGRCACVPIGGQCYGNGALCCTNGFGGAACNADGLCCLGRFGFCQHDSDCCSNNCNFGFCQ